jgi:D-alanyl-D-alanine carboxypeptidase
VTQRPGQPPLELPAVAEELAREVTLMQPARRPLRRAPPYRENRQMRRIARLLAGIALLAAPGAAGADPTPLQSQLDATLHDARTSTGAPAATAAIMRCGQLVWSGADGTLDTSSGRQATTTTRFAIASSTKPITATLVLGLVQRKKLSLKTRLARFYPHLPKAKKITIRMLLDHTSGLNDYFDDAHVNDLIAKHPDHRWKRSEILKAIKKTLFKPGTKYSYSNSNYVVLGGILEKVTHKSVESLFRARIAVPLGLENSTFAYHPEQSNLFAHPYLRSGSGLQDQFAPGIGVPSDFWGPVWTDGGLAASAQDLARFGDGLFEEKLLSHATLTTMTRLDRFGGGLGLFHAKYAGHSWLGHNGRYGGYETEIWTDRARRVTFAVATDVNQSSLATWHQLVTTYDAGPPTQPCAAVG